MTKHINNQQLVIDLKNLYTAYGYKQFKMSKFEEYGVYLDNKKFLRSPYVITFNDLNGKLMALKPDVTLSIVKNTKATSTTCDKVFYNESVYRPDGTTKEYKEISQIGLELIGDVDGYCTAEVVCLAAKSLQQIDDSFVLDVSHLGVVLGLLGQYGITQNDEVLGYISSKNTHDLANYCKAKNIDDGFAQKVTMLTNAKGCFCEVLAQAKQIATNDVSQKALQELQVVCDTIGQMGFADKVRLDFSIINDTDYYNGIVLQGYVEGSPNLVLSGGRYDKLASKFVPDVNALGFAIYLNEVVFAKDNNAFDGDVLLLYKDDTEVAEVVAKTNQLVSQGKIVRVAKNQPNGLRFKETIIL